MTKLSFEMALANMKRGKMVRRASDRCIAYRVERPDYFSVWRRTFDSNGAECWEFFGMFTTVPAADILAEDWEVCE